MILHTIKSCTSFRRGQIRFDLGSVLVYIGPEDVEHAQGMISLDEFNAKAFSADWSGLCRIPIVGKSSSPSP